MGVDSITVIPAYPDLEKPLAELKVDIAKVQVVVDKIEKDVKAIKEK